MEKIIISNEKPEIDSPPFTVINIPQYKNIPKYTKFKNFLENNIEKFRAFPSCDNLGVGALEVEGSEVKINLSKCMGCMACLSTSKNLNELAKNPRDILTSIYPSNLIEKIKQNRLFDKTLFQFPFFPNRRTKTFAQFTSTKETTHISLWAATIINFLCSSSDSRLGREIEIMKMDKPRDGRLDICVDSGDLIIVGEAKTDLDSLLSENRYRLQIPSYEKECNRFIKDFNSKYNKNKKLAIFLIVGGEESDLLPEEHPECSSRTGNKSKRFYADLIKNNIKFISANSLLLMILYSLYHNKRSCFDLLLNKIYNEDFVGLTTAGIIKKRKEKIILEEISLETINSVVKAFS